MKTHEVKQIKRGPVVAFGAGVVALVTGLGWQAANGGPAQSTVAPDNTIPQVASQTPAGYQPSQFPGVSVRHVPEAQTAAQTSKSKGSAGWIYVKPGTKWTAAKAAQAQGGMTNRRVRSVGIGRSAAGGKVVYLDESKMPFETAHRNPNGSVTLSCDQDSHLHSLAEHKAHHAKVAPVSPAHSNASR